MRYSYQSFFFDKIPFYLTFLLPAFIVSGPFLSDLAISICAIIFLINSYKNKLIFYYKNIFFYFFISFYIYLNLSALLSSNIIFSLKTSLPYIRFGIFALSTWYLININNKLLKYFFYCFLFVFLFLEIDGIYQYINKKNLFDYPLIQDRVSSLFGNELILGSFLSRNFPLFLGLFFFLEKNNLKKKIKVISYVVIIFLPVLVFMSGERSSVFYTLLAMVYIFIFFPKKNIFILFLSSILLVSIGIVSLEKRFSERIIDQTKIQLTFEQEKNKRLNIFSITHEQHYRSAFKIFKDNVFFGAGPKSFRLKCSEEKYLISETSCISHPHNTYMQLLSETGIIGFFFIFFIFVIFCVNSIKIIYSKYFKGNRISPLKICLFASFLITLWPIIPSGNFFTNWLNVVYYLPIGFFLWLTKVKKNDESIKC